MSTDTVHRKDCKDGPSTPRTARVRRFAKNLAAVLLAVAPIVPLMVLVELVFLRAAPASLANALGLPSSIPIPPARGLVAIGLGALPSFATARALLELRACAQRIAGGDMFGARVVRDLRAASTSMLAASVLEMVVPTLAALVLTLGSGHLSFIIHFSSGSLMAFVLAASLRLTSGLIVEARSLAAENAEFV